MRTSLGPALLAIAATVAFVACITPVSFDDPDDEDDKKSSTSTKDKDAGPGSTTSGGTSGASGTSGTPGTSSGSTGTSSSGGTSGNPPVDSGTDVFVPEPTPCGEDKPLVGSTNTALISDNVLSNEVNAFPYMPAANGSGRCFRVFVATGTVSIKVGVYTDKAGVPGSLLTQGTIASPTVGWNKAVLGSSVPFAVGQRVWLAVVAATGEFDIKVNKDCTGRRRHENANGTLPSTFTPDPLNTFCDGAMYLSP